MSDVQCGHEKTLTGLTSALAGANAIYGAGMLDSGLTLDYGQLVLDNELAAMIRQFVLGIEVSDETLLLDEIHAIGSSGDFMSTEATLAHMRDCSTPRLLDRRVYEDWQADGGRDAIEKARQQAREILRNHKPQALDPDVAGEIRRIVDEADASLGQA